MLLYKLLFILPNIYYLYVPYIKKIKKYIPQQIIEKKITPGVFYSYVFSTIHACVISSASIAYLTSAINENTYKFASLYSLSYLTSDIITMFREEKFKKMRNIMTLHHAILIYTIFKLNYTNDYILNHNIPIIAKLYLAEICVIFMNINWLLIKLEKKDTLSFKISNLLLKVSYYIFRVHNFITLTKYYLTTYGIDISFISLLLITALNISWFILLLFK